MYITINKGASLWCAINSFDVLYWTLNMFNFSNDFDVIIYDIIDC